MRIKKYWAVFILSLLTIQLFANHERGGITITYKSVGAFTGDNLDYEVRAYAMYSKGVFSGVVPTSLPFDLISSCYPTQVINLQKQNGPDQFGLFPFPFDNYCDPFNTISNNYGFALFIDTVKLPGVCASFNFERRGSSAFGLYSAFDNLNFAFGLTYNSVFINNINGPNSSPQVSFQDLVSLNCLSRPIDLFNFTESDGDSLFFRVSKVQTSNFSSIVQDVNYGPGYSVLDPFGTNSFSIDPATGNIKDTSNAIRDFLIVLEWLEFRTNSSGTAVLVGSGRIQSQLIVSGGCTTSPFGLLQASGNALDSVSCGDSTIQVLTSRKLAFSSISTNNSEFNLNSTVDPNLSVAGSRRVNDSTIELQLSGPIKANDQISLFLDTAIDGNTLISICGNEIPASRDTLLFASPPGVQPQASINVTPSFLNVQFDASTTTNSVQNIWDFGDGSPLDTSVTTNHTYQQPGNYNVILTAINNCGETDSATISLEVCLEPDSAFSAFNDQDSLNLRVDSVISGITYLWNFGDGTSGSGSNANHIYNVDSVYTVTLTAFNNCGDTLISTTTVETCTPPVAQWTATRTNLSAGYVISFDGTASSNYDSFEWDFGDGRTNSSTLTPSYTYIGDPANYTVSLKLINNCGTSDSLAYTLAEISKEEWTLGNFSFYPNPVSEKLNVIFEEPASYSSLKILTLDGKLLHTQKIKNRSRTVSLDLKSFAPGYYVLQLLGEQQQTRSFIKH